MDQKPTMQRSYLPTEIQLQIIQHLARDFSQDLPQPASSQPWRNAHSCTCVNRTWFEEFAVVLTRIANITDVISYAIGPSLIDAVLRIHLHQHESREAVTEDEPDLRAYAFACTRRNLATSLRRVLSLQTQRMSNQDQKWLISITMRNRYLTCAEILVPRYVSPHNFPIRSIIRERQIDSLEWMIRHAAPVKGTTWSLLALALKTCSSSDGVPALETRKTREILQLLLDNGAEVGALELKILKQNQRFEELLLANEPRENPQACLERMVVHYGRYYYSFDYIIDRCLERGADPNVRVDDWPLLSRAIQRRSLAVCEQLLKYGANPSPACEWNKTPLHCAVRRIGRNYHDLLVRFGATPRQNYCPRWSWASFESYKSDLATMRKADPPSKGPANPPRVVHQPTEEENAREQLKWISIADALAPRGRPSTE